MNKPMNVTASNAAWDEANRVAAHLTDRYCDHAATGSACQRCITTVIAESVEKYVRLSTMLDKVVRLEWWFRHGCPPHALYGDDGEMQCSACGTDFKRTPFLDLQRKVTAMRDDRVREQLKEAGFKEGCGPQCASEGGVAHEDPCPHAGEMVVEYTQDQLDGYGHRDIKEAQEKRGWIEVDTCYAPVDPTAFSMEDRVIVTYWRVERVQACIPANPSLTDPCAHPARKGRHETYRSESGTYCKACGAEEQNGSES